MISPMPCLQILWQRLIPAMSNEVSGMERNVRLYPWYAAAFNAFFWMPVFFLYFSERFSLDRVLILEAAYYAAVVLMEVPSGYFSDSLGRRPTLLVSSGALVAAYALFFSGAGFPAFVAAQVCLAAGIAFNSGTDTSFHFDSLAGLGRENEFPDREARVARNVFVAGAGAALLGGAVGVFQLRFAYGLSLLGALITFLIVLATVEPTSRTGHAQPDSGFIRQLNKCLGHLRSPALFWLFGFSVLMTVLNHVPYEFYQPYLDFLALDLSLPANGTPLAAGLHMGVTMLLGAWFASRSIRFRDRLGLGPLLLICVLFQTVIIALMGLVLHPVIVLLVLLRGLPRALMTAPLNAAIAPQVPQAQRATYLSIQSLVGRLSFSGVLLLLSVSAGSDTPTDWPSVSWMLCLSGGIGVVGLLVLAATRGRLK
jgi:MFS family permease